MRTLSRLAMSIPALALVFAAGCGSNLIGVAASPSLAGNWNFQAAAAPANASQIAHLGGPLMVSSTGAITGILHALPFAGNDASSLCYAPANNIPVTGSLDTSGTLTLTSSNFAGNTLVIHGTYVAGSGSTLPSLTNASYSITGPCGVTVPNTTSYQAAVLNGAYTGTAYLSGDAQPGVTHYQGVPFQFSATFSQATNPDVNGFYDVTGSATFPPDPCVTGTLVTVPIDGVNDTTYVNSYNTVTGNQFNVTFKDPVTQTVLTASGFSLDSTNSGITLYLGLRNPTSAYAQCDDEGGADLYKQP